MAQVIQDLEISEVSLCDFGSNSEFDPVTGQRVPRSTIALHKRDDGRSYLSKRELRARMDRVEAERTGQLRSLQDRCTAVGQQISEVKKMIAANRANLAERLANEKEKPMGIIRKCLAAVDDGSVQKCALTKGDFTEALKRLAAKQGTMLSGDGAKLYQGYCDAPADVLKAEPVMIRVTKAESELDSRARRRMKKDSSLSYAKACSLELMDDPELYDQYSRELANGATYQVPGEQVEYLKRTKQDDETCPECGEETDDGAKFCASCGEKLPTAKRGHKPAA